ncbi:homoserine kinase [Convivina praedatoris]|uniref:Homoserine kinase n=1 Tax=Convivina praedatoris TaxID=2880963 RepID=A0ABM9D3A3_9LACO|nr:homoserine kinase [Convivina sp. LMG 32447]CAH1851943.1 Homoserine kinase [Convivina sp. LMG 32447]CAH1853998.1 Homoserine kinase [Convivina sp. LMG 32447]
MQFTIQVPASSANLGPGFDSLGLAVSRYLRVQVLEPTSKWVVDHPFGDSVPHNHNNLIVQIAQKLALNLPAHHLIVSSDIPLARGLGSSSSAILAGIALANELGQLALSPADMLLVATQLEGHPDNVAPALLGGGVAAYYDQKNVYQAPLTFPEDFKLVTFIPNYPLKTADARAALATELALPQAVAASAVANVMIASWQAGNIEQARRLMEADEFHEQARADLVPHLAKIRQIAHALGIYGTYLSGAGPTTVTLTTGQQAQALITRLQALDLPGEIVALEPDFNGLVIQPKE